MLKRSLALVIYGLGIALLTIGILFHLRGDSLSAQIALIRGLSVFIGWSGPLLLIEKRSLHAPKLITALFGIAFCIITLWLLMLAAHEITQMSFFSLRLIPLLIGMLAFAYHFVIFFKTSNVVDAIHLSTIIILSMATSLDGFGWDDQIQATFLALLSGIGVPLMTIGDVLGLRRRIL